MVGLWFAPLYFFVVAFVAVINTPHTTNRARWRDGEERRGERSLLIRLVPVQPCVLFHVMPVLLLSRVASQ